MSISRLSAVLRGGCFGGVLALFQGGESVARLSEFEPFQMLSYVDAIHRPTGCMSTLELDGSTLLAAFITDPLCLPAGVDARPIPAFERDFHLPSSGGIIPLP